jgi:hypothetical protein
MSVAQGVLLDLGDRRQIVKLFGSGSRLGIWV